MLRITELRLPLEHAKGALRAAVLARLALADEQLRELTVFRRAWDARKKSAVMLSYTVDCLLADGVDESAVLARLAGDRQVRLAPDTTYRFVGHAPADFAASDTPRRHSPQVSCVRSRTAVPRSSTIGRSPICASTSAAKMPQGPKPTTTGRGRPDAA